MKLNPQQYRAQISLLRQLPPVQSPAALRSPEFLESIYEHAAANSVDHSGVDLGQVMRAELPPLQALEDAVWCEVEDQKDIVAPLTQVLPDGKAPGWLWSRIKSDMHLELAQRRRQARLRLGTRVAAMLLVSVGLVFALRSTFSSGLDLASTDRNKIVFESVSSPLAAPFHPTQWTRELAGSPR